LPDGAFSWLGQWVRHNIVSVLATGVDFATMIGLVELLHFSPVMGTVVGAALAASPASRWGGTTPIAPKPIRFRPDAPLRPGVWR
jgi:hypothetical protein